MKEMKKNNYSVMGIISALLGLVAIIIIILTYNFLGMLFEGIYYIMGFNVIYVLKFLNKLEIFLEVVGLLLGVISVVQRKGKISFGIIGSIINGSLLIWVLYSIINQ